MSETQYKGESWADAVDRLERELTAARAEAQQAASDYNALLENRDTWRAQANANLQRAETAEAEAVYLLAYPNVLKCSTCHRKTANWQVRRGMGSYYQCDLCLARRKDLLLLIETPLNQAQLEWRRRFTQAEGD